MTKNDIVKSIAEDLGITKKEAKEIVQKLFDGITKTLVEEGRVELRNFGVFTVKRHAAHKARNPGTGETVFVPEKSVVTFKAGRNLQQLVAESEKVTRG